MKSLFKVLWEFLRSIFGGKKDPADDGGGSGGKDDTPTQGGGSGSLKDPTQWDLVRFDVGTVDTLGKLYFNGEFKCYTIEQSTNRANLGKYELTLRTRGGLHATYGFRFKDIHKGVIQLLINDSQDFRFIRTGNVAADSGGGIVLGKVIEGRQNTAQAREVWHSEDAYRDVYPLIANRIDAGEKMTIHITLDPNG